LTIYNAWIFTLGTEVTQGRIVNTNASYLGRRLTLLGFRVIGIISLIDDVDTIARYLTIVLNERPKVIVTTGGLGPTYDDRTLEAVARALNKKLILNDEAFNIIKEKYKARNMPLTEERIKMAYLPEGGVAIPNPIGTAPGCWLEVGDTIIVSLPGVPQEMEAMWEYLIEPKLRSIGPSVYIAEILLKIVGVPESSLAPIIKNILKDSPPEVYIKSHPKEGTPGKPIIELYIMYSNEDKEKADKVAKEIMNKMINSIKQRFEATIETISMNIS
jgi:nicotinamide-nucleotide amidase